MGGSLIDEVIRLAGLTPREYEVLAELRTQKSRKEIAAALNCSLRTVAFHAGEFLTGVLAVSKPRQLMAFRTMLGEGATIDQARAISRW